MQGFKEKKKLISLIVIQYIFCISLSLDMEVTRGLSDFLGVVSSHDYQAPAALSSGLISSTGEEKMQKNVEVYMMKKGLRPGLHLQERNSSLP